MKVIEKYLTMSKEEQIKDYKNLIRASGGRLPIEEVFGYLNGEAPKNPLEEIGAELMEITSISRFEKWKIETENHGTVYINIRPKSKSFDVIGTGTVGVAKAIAEYLETL